MQSDDGVRHVRSIWASNVHLGTRGCQADLLLNFLRRHGSEYLYLVGDIVDGWSPRRNWYWPQSRPMEGVRYCNDGDWVESCTALVELASGELQIVDWAASRRLLPARAAA